MKRMLLAVLTLLAGQVDASAKDLVGFRSISVAAPHRAEPLAVTLWYPAGEGGEATFVGRNKVFAGVEAELGAPIAAGTFPLVLLAHGGLRSAPHLDGWIASSLAAGGYLVASVRGPALGEGDAAKAVAEIGLRPQDLSTALTALVEQDAEIRSRLRPGAVGALGFFLGGSSVLALAGARLDRDAFVASCDQVPGGRDCDWFAKAGVDLRRADVTPLLGAKIDRRIGAVVAVNPELVGSFAEASLARIEIPVAVVMLGEDAAGGGARLGRSMPGAAISALPEATIFSAFDLCTRAGAEILSSEGDDAAICGDGGVPRAAVHARLAAIVRSAFDRAFARK